MKIVDRAWDTVKWRYIKRHLGYTDDELALFRKKNSNEEVLDKGRQLSNKMIVMEIVDSRGCNSQHKVGDRFYFDGAGNLLTKSGPEKICIHALNAVTSLIYAANELFYAGIDPNEMRFKRAGCIDVGVQCGGWGRIVVECKMIDQE